MLVDHKVFEERMVAIRAEVARCISEGKKLFNLDLSKVQVRYDVKGRVGGWAGSKYGTYFVRLNRQMIGGEGYEHMLNETVSHEFAHIICYMNPSLGRRHDYGWTRVHRMLGGNGARCHNVDSSVNTGGYDYLTDRGHVVTFTKTRHNKLQRSIDRCYRFKHGKGAVTRESQWKYRAPGQPVTLASAFKAGTSVPAMRTPVRITGTKDRIMAALFGFGLGAPEDRILPPQQPAKVSTPSVMGSKASQVRQYIHHAKLNGFSQDSVIQRAQDQLAMSKGQAYRYVTENWPKVL